MKFRSLIFREIKLSRRIIILQSGLLLAWVALTWGALLSADANKLTDEELLGVSSAVVVMMPLIAALPMLINNDFKSDINSGWLGYSYALPISPLERTAARFSVRYAVCAVNVLLGLCDAAAVLAYSGNTLSSEHIVWYIVVFAAAILYSLPNDIMLLRSRSAADMKKMQTAAGMTEVAIMAVLVVALMKINGVKLQDIAEGNDKGFMDNTFFSAGSLLWAVPLLLALTAANFFASYRSLSSAYPLVRKAEREPAETRAAVASRTDGVKGLLYKELKQNRLMLIFAALVPLLLTAFPFCFSAIGVMTGGTGVDEIEKPDDRWFVQMTVYGNDTENPHNADFCNGVRQISDNISDLESYSISTETYQTEKEKVRNYYSRPVSKKDFPELSREERQKKHLDWVKQHLKDE